MGKDQVGWLANWLAGWRDDEEEREESADGFVF